MLYLLHVNAKLSNQTFSWVLRTNHKQPNLRLPEFAPIRGPSWCLSKSSGLIWFRREMGAGGSHMIWEGTYLRWTEILGVDSFSSIFNHGSFQKPAVSPGFCMVS